MSDNNLKLSKRNGDSIMKAEYGYWMQKAKNEIDLKQVLKSFQAKEDVCSDFEGLENQEMEGWHNIIRYFIDKGIDYRNIEHMIYEFGGEIQQIYIELGIRIGARLLAESKFERKV